MVRYYHNGWHTAALFGDRYWANSFVAGPAGCLSTGVLLSHNADARRKDQLDGLVDALAPEYWPMSAMSLLGADLNLLPPWLWD